MARFSQITINGTDVTSYVINWKFSDTSNDAVNIKEIKIQLKLSIKSILTLNFGDEVIVQKGKLTPTETYLFRGNVRFINLESGFYEIICYDPLYEAVKRNVNKYYLFTADPSAGQINEIVKDLLITYSLLDCDDGTIQDPEIVIKEFPCRSCDPAERIRVLSAIPGYVCYYNPTDAKIYWEPVKSTTNPNVIHIGGTNNNIARYGKWERIQTGWLCNDLTLNGAVNYVEQTETFAGAHDSVKLDQVPDSVYVTADGVELIGGNEASSSYDYTIQKENKTINFVSTETNIVVKYSYSINLPVQITDANSQSLYGVWASTITLTDVMTIDDAELLAQAYVDNHKNPYNKNWIEIPYLTQKVNEYKLNDKVTINDAKYPEMNGNYIIYKIEESYPEQNTKIYITSVLVKENTFQEDIVTRLKRLEENAVASNDIITNMIKSGDTFYPSKKQLQVQTEYLTDALFENNDGDNGKLQWGKALELAFTTADYSSSEFSLSENIDTDYILVGSKSLKVESSTEQTGYITTTKTFGDLSSYLGSTSGTPAQGTFAIWIKNIDATMNTIKLKIGSSASDYIEIEGKSIHTSTGWGAETFELLDDITYIVFRTSDGIVTGTPDWTAVDYMELELNNLNNDLYLSFFSVSKSNKIGLNTFGSRNITITNYSS